MGGFLLRKHQSHQTQRGSTQYNQKRHGCPAEVLPEGRDAQKQAEENQNQNRAGYVKVLQRFLCGYLISGSDGAGGKNTGANGNTNPQHGAPSIGGNDQSTNGWPDDHRCAGKKHIQGKSLCDFFLRELRCDIGKDHRGHSRRADTYDKSRDHHKNKGVCSSGEKIPQGKYGDPQQQRPSASDHISHLAEDRCAGGGGHSLSQRRPCGVIISDPNVLHKSRP